MVGGVMVEKGDVGEVVGMGGKCVDHLLYHHRMHCWLYREGCWSVGVQLGHDAFARMGEGPSHQVNMGVEWRGEGGI